MFDASDKLIIFNKSEGQEEYHWQVYRHAKSIGDLLSVILTWSNDNKLKDLSWSSPSPPALLPLALPAGGFCHAVVLQRLQALRLFGYCAWSQSPVNQISSDPADPADKTLHGERKWQTAGDTRPDYERSLKRDWSQRLFKPKKRLPRLEIYCLCAYFYQIQNWLSRIYTLFPSTCLFIWTKKTKTPSVQGVTSFLLKVWMMLCKNLILCRNTVIRV